MNNNENCNITRWNDRLVSLRLFLLGMSRNPKKNWSAHTNYGNKMFVLEEKKYTHLTIEWWWWWWWFAIDVITMRSHHKHFCSLFSHTPAIRIVLLILLPNTKRICQLKIALNWVSFVDDSLVPFRKKNRFSGHTIRSTDIDFAYFRQYRHSFQHEIFVLEKSMLDINECLYRCLIKTINKINYLFQNWVLVNRFAIFFWTKMDLSTLKIIYFRKKIVLIFYFIYDVLQSAKRNVKSSLKRILFG